MISELFLYTFARDKSQGTGTTTKRIIAPCADFFWLRPRRPLGAAGSLFYFSREGQVGSARWHGRETVPQQATGAGAALQQGLAQTYCAWAALKNFENSGSLLT